ncbi:hypothetical protein LCGC14_1381990 [marine sediment metagenome]|uniref:Uncharacterized protein n=1 Tax=marine sediment metagenome TaxID=412755 RepID=A0A0F9MHU5_9ZZZZ
MNILEGFTRWRTKRQYRSAYVAYMRLFDQQGGGHEIAQHMFPDMRRLASRFDAAADKLVELGVAVTEFRLQREMRP